MRQTKQGDLKYVEIDGDEIDYIRIDNKDNLTIVTKKTGGFNGKLVRIEGDHDYSIKYMFDDELESDKIVVNADRNFRKKEARFSI